MQTFRSAETSTGKRPLLLFASKPTYTISPWKENHATTKIVIALKPTHLGGKLLYYELLYKLFKKVDTSMPNNY